MPPTLTRNTTRSESEEIALTPDYCYEQAAEVLAGRAPLLPGGMRETFDCWLLLAESLRDHASS
jgi:hypothetical protein